MGFWPVRPFLAEPFQSGAARPRGGAAPRRPGPADAAAPAPREVFRRAATWATRAASLLGDCGGLGLGGGDRGLGLVGPPSGPPLRRRPPHGRASSAARRRVARSMAEDWRLTEHAVALGADGLDACGAGRARSGGHRPEGRRRAPERGGVPIDARRVLGRAGGAWSAALRVRHRLWQWRRPRPHPPPRPQRAWRRWQGLGGDAGSVLDVDEVDPQRSELGVERRDPVLGGRHGGLGALDVVGGGDSLVGIRRDDGQPQQGCEDDGDMTVRRRMVSVRTDLGSPTTITSSRHRAGRRATHHFRPDYGISSQEQQSRHSQGRFSRSANYTTVFR